MSDTDDEHMSDAERAEARAATMSAEDWATAFGAEPTGPRFEHGYREESERMADELPEMGQPQFGDKDTWWERVSDGRRVKPRRYRRDSTKIGDRIRWALLRRLAPRVNHVELLGYSASLAGYTDFPELNSVRFVVYRPGNRP